MALIRCENGHMFSERRYGNICPYCNIAVIQENEAGDKAGGGDYLQSLEALKPVVGWLVCIEGIAKGRDFRIVSQKNFIGRSADMDIRIQGDSGIATKNHATIVYDPKKRVTLLIPGDAQGLTYLNGNAIYAPRELSAYDVLEMGDSKLIFIPLCGENFEWEL